jgi:hypothetical protein
VAVQDLIRELQARGVEVQVLDDRLRYRPKEAVPRELREALVAHKAELRVLLSAEDEALFWRLQSMRSQTTASGPIPFLLARPDELARDAPGCCLSCGEALLEGQRYRCRLCAQATSLVLREAREGL